MNPHDDHQRYQTQVDLAHELLLERFVPFCIVGIESSKVRVHRVIVHQNVGLRDIVVLCRRTDVMFLVFEGRWVRHLGEGSVTASQ